jgi:hypothetical protein
MTCHFKLDTVDPICTIRFECEAICSDQHVEPRDRQDHKLKGAVQGWLNLEAGIKAASLVAFPDAARHARVGIAFWKEAITGTSSTISLYVCITALWMQK